MIEELAAGFPILSCLLFLPFVGAAVLWLVDDEDMIRTSALTISLVELALAVFVLLRFVPDSSAMQFAEHVRWIPALGVSYHLAVDGISVLFVGLTAFLTVLVIVYSWDTIRHQVKLYMMCLLALETTTMGVFVSLDLILFFVFWELMLIPSYFLIKLWGGGAERHNAALKYSPGQRLHAGRDCAAGPELSSLGRPQAYRATLLLRPARFAGSTHSRQPTDPDLLAHVHGVRLQSPGLSVSYMVARCAARGSHRHGGRARRSEARNLRLHPIQHPLAA
jgi:hypothetical protein